jgi:SPP1 family predicted phage head-tail adaptor
MAMNKAIKIQKLNVDTEVWEDYYCCYAEVNKASGREYFNAKTNITENTFNFKIRYISKLEDTIFNTTQYRIIYKNNTFNIINVDDKQEKHLKLTFVAECVTV